MNLNFSHGRQAVEREVPTNTGHKRPANGIDDEEDDGASFDGHATQESDARQNPLGHRRARRKTNSPLIREASQNSPMSVAHNSNWPDLLKSLEKTHQALNLIYTFCCTRRHLATTFETIKPAVERQTGQQVTEEEVAQIVALRPEGIKFSYVDELMLQLEIKGSERDNAFRKSNSHRSQIPVHDASVGGWTGSESLSDLRHREPGQARKEVLYFEFIDGDLKRQVLDTKTGEPVKPNRKLRDERLKMPVYGQKQMTQLIERRNLRFRSSIDAFLKRCMENSEDPITTLKQLAKPLIPKPSLSTHTSADHRSRPIPENIPTQRKTIPEIVQEIKDSPWYTGQVVPDGHRVFEPQEPIYGTLAFLLSQDLVNALYNAKGITKFFAHQAEALNQLHEGKHVVVATSTSSGKSLIYQLPVLYSLEKNPETRAMYIFPTKALAQDQKRSLREVMAYMSGFEDVLVETFDGDTPMNERTTIREQARIIFTNPDMLHLTLLPQEERWRSFLKDLRYVVGK